MKNVSGSRVTPIVTQTIAAVALTLSYAGYASADAITLPVAAIDADVTQCEVQTCGTSGNVSYNGPLSGFAGTIAAGENSSITATGFPFPTLTSTVPAGGANALLTAELDYYFEVVPLDGNQNITPVQIGVNASGSTSASTVSGVPAIGNNAGNTLVFEIMQGAAFVLDDQVVVDYTDGENDEGTCFTENFSGVRGLGVVSTPGVDGATIGCGSSFMFGGFTDTGTYTLDSNTPESVAMIANVTVGCSNNGLAEGPGSCAGSSFVDPLITAPAGYEIVLSDGVGNSVAATPEPGTSALLAAGLLLCAGIARRLTSDESRYR